MFSTEKFQFLKAASMKMAVFWVFIPYSLVEVYPDDRTLQRISVDYPCRILSDLLSGFGEKRVDEQMFSP